MRQQSNVIPFPPEHAEKREYPRVEAHFTVHLETDDELIEVRSMDISQGGAFLYTDKTFEFGTDVALFFIHPVDETEVMIKGKVIRHSRSSSGDPGIGVLFSCAGSAKAQQVMSLVKDELRHIGPKTFEQVIVDSAWVVNG